MPRQIATNRSKSKQAGRNQLASYNLLVGSQTIGGSGWSISPATLAENPQGTTGTLTGPAGTITITGISSTTVAITVANNYINIISTSSGNNTGLFAVTSFISSSSVTISNPSFIGTTDTITSFIFPASLSVSGSTVTLTGLVGVSMNSPTIQITSATNNANKGTFTITNYISSNSVQFTNASAVNETGTILWICPSAPNLSVTANTTLAPDGTMTAYKITNMNDLGVTQQHYLTNSFTETITDPNQFVTYSIYAKLQDNVINASGTFYPVTGSTTVTTSVYQSGLISTSGGFITFTGTGNGNYAVTAITAAPTISQTFTVNNGSASVSASSSVASILFPGMNITFSGGSGPASGTYNIQSVSGSTIILTTSYTSTSSSGSSATTTSSTITLGAAYSGGGSGIATTANIIGLGYICFRLGSATQASTIFPEINLVSQTVINLGTITPTIVFQNVGNGWTRISITWDVFTLGTGGHSGSSLGRIYVAPSQDVAVGNGYVYLWGAQLVGGKIPGIYTPTTTAIKPNGSGKSLRKKTSLRKTP